MSVVQISNVTAALEARKAALDFRKAALQRQQEEAERKFVDTISDVIAVRINAAPAERYYERYREELHLDLRVRIASVKRYAVLSRSYKQTTLTLYGRVCDKIVQRLRSHHNMSTVKRVTVTSTRETAQNSACCWFTLGVSSIIKACIHTANVSIIFSKPEALVVAIASSTTAEELEAPAEPQAGPLTLRVHSPKQRTEDRRLMQPRQTARVAPEAVPAVSAVPADTGESKDDDPTL